MGRILKEVGGREGDVGEGAEGEEHGGHEQGGLERLYSVRKKKKSHLA